jgi:RimJ/RimL family protein N-acetyltransferase
MYEIHATPAPARYNRNVSGGWLTRRWYYTPKSHRPYSVRQISPGDRRLLAEFALTLGQSTPERDRSCVRELSDMLFERVLAGGVDRAAGHAALEGTAAGDRIIGVAAYAPTSLDEAHFSVAVSAAYRDEQIGRMLLATLVRHAKRVGLRRLQGEMHWANRPMHRLAQSTGFAVEAVSDDRLRRRLVLAMK